MINKIQNSYSPSFGKFEIQGDPCRVMRRISTDYIHNSSDEEAPRREKLITNLIKKIVNLKTKVITDGIFVMVEEPRSHAILGIPGSFGNYEDNKHAFFCVDDIKGDSDYAATETKFLRKYNPYSEGAWTWKEGIKVPLKDCDAFVSDFYNKGYDTEFIDKLKAAYEIARFFDKGVSTKKQKMHNTYMNLLMAAGLECDSKGNE